MIDCCNQIPRSDWVGRWERRVAIGFAVDGAAVHHSCWKLRLSLAEMRTNLRDATARSEARLYDLVNDIGETTNVAAAHPEVVERLEALAELAR